MLERSIEAQRTSANLKMKNEHHFFGVFAMSTLEHDEQQEPISITMRAMSKFILLMLL